MEKIQVNKENLMSNEYLMECRSVGKTYRTGDEELQVLKGLDFQLASNEFVAITGESGCGKSTLLHLLGCLDEATEGDIIYKEISLVSLPASKRDSVRNRDFGFVFQFHYLLPEFSALENVMLPGMIAGTSESELHKQACILLEDLGLEERKNAKPFRLSGGEQQRVAVARSLINQPSILFMDEPTGNLDPHHSLEMVKLIKDQQEKYHLAIVMVTHNQEIASMADRHLGLKDGVLCQLR